MTHAINQLALILAGTMSVITGIVAYALYRRKKSTGIRALNLLIYLFISLSVLGLCQVLQFVAHDFLFFFPTDEGGVPLIYSPVRIANLVVLLVLYFFAENILEIRSNIFRLSLLVGMISGIIFTSLIGNALGSLITTDMILPFANPTRFDEFLFDILQFYVVSFIAYLFAQQYEFTESSQYRKYILLILLATATYFISMIFEVLEHLLPGSPNVNAFISAFPTIALLAYIYLRYPNMIYLVPTNVQFLQLVGVESGIPVYVAEFEEEERAMDFLIGPGLSSIRTMLKELLLSSDPKKSYFQMKSFEYSGGYLIFEESSGLFALLQADQVSRVLLTSLSYFIKEFEETFGDQIYPFKGSIKPVNGTSPDDLLRKCVPIVQAKPIISSIGENDND